MYDIMSNGMRQFSELPMEEIINYFYMRSVIQINYFGNNGNFYIF